MGDDSRASILSGLTCSVGLHALLGLSLAVWGDRPVQAPLPARDEQLVIMLPAEEPQPPEPPKPDIQVPPPEPVPPPPEPQPEPPLRLGIEDSKADTPAWLGFKEATEHNAPKADIDQSAMELEPGRPGPPGPPAPPPSPAPPTPVEAARPAAGAPAQATPPPPVTPPTPEQNQPTIPPETAPPAPGKPEVEPPAKPVPEPSDLPRPEPAKADPAAPAPTPAPEGSPTPEGQRLPDGPGLDPRQPDQPPDRGETKPPEQVVVPGKPVDAPPVEKPEDHEVEVGPKPEQPSDALKPPPQNPAEAVPEPSKEMGPPVPESLAPVNELSGQPRPGPEATAPPEPTPPVEAAPAPPVTPGAGGTDGRPGEKADRESDPSSMKPIRLDRWKLGQVLAGEGLNVRTTRPRWSTTTLLTATAPKNPTVYVVFGRSGKVLEAGFVDEKTTGYDNVDEPLINALHSWTAAGKRIRELPADDPKAGVKIVFIITLR